MASDHDLDLDRYDLDADGLPREIVGPWVRDKHLRLEKYIDISRGVRADWLGSNKAGATYIDLFAGPGRAIIRESSEIVDGSPITAWRTAVRRDTPFSKIYVADSDALLLDACEERLRRLDAPVISEVGEATTTVDRIISDLNPYGLHLAFLDPYKLGALSFDIIRKLARMKRMDIILHVSTQDFQRNLRAYIEQQPSPLDSFAPGWRSKVDITRPANLIRGKILEYWRELLMAEGMKSDESHPLVVGTKNQRLYWLAFAARHERALEFWNKIKDIEPTKQGTLL